MKRLTYRGNELVRATTFDKDGAKLVVEIENGYEVSRSLYDRNGLLRCKLGVL